MLVYITTTNVEFEVNVCYANFKILIFLIQNMFQVNNSWRCHRSELLQAIFPKSEVQRYRIIEIPVNSQIFHADIQTKNEGELCWSRYLFFSFRDILDFVAVEGIVGCKVSIQSSRCDSKEYSILAIHQAFEVIDHPGAYFFKCSDGRFRRDSMHEFSLEDAKLILTWDLESK